MIRTNVAIRTKSPELIEFFYPNFTKVSEFSPFISGGVIFSGESKYLQNFRDNKIPYIYVKGTPEYDLTVPENLLKFVFDKWDKEPTKALTEYFKLFDKVNVGLENIAKLIWVTGKYSLEEDVDAKLQNVYSLLVRGSMYDILYNFLCVSENMNIDKLFYKIQRFLKSANNAESISNVYIAKYAKAFKESKSGNVEQALMNYLYSKADNVELKLLKFFESISVVKGK